MSETVLKIAKQELSMTKPNPTGHRHHRPRHLQRKFLTRAKTARWLRKAAWLFDNYIESRSSVDYRTLYTLLTIYKDYDGSCMPNPPDQPVKDNEETTAIWLNWREDVRVKTKVERKERKHLRKDDVRHKMQKARKFMQRLLATKQSAANKKIRRSSSDSKTITLFRRC